MDTFIAILWGGVNNAYVHEMILVSADNRDAAKRKAFLHWEKNIIITEDRISVTHPKAII
jgi:hypothetical protein